MELAFFKIHDFKVCLLQNSMPLSLEQQSLIDYLFPPPKQKMGEKRKLSYYNARLGLLKLLESLNIPRAAVQKSPQNYALLFEGIPLFYSLSHTQDYALACCASGPIGIDFEIASRQIAVNARHLFKNDKDQKEEQLLDLWVKKEAGFKALSESLPQDQQLLKSLYLQEDIAYSDFCTPHAQIYLEKKNALNQDFIIAIASLSQKNSQI